MADSKVPDASTTTKYCSSCGGRHYSKVHFCPFCGQAASKPNAGIGASTSDAEKGASAETSPGPSRPEGVAPDTKAAQPAKTNPAATPSKEEKIPALPPQRPEASAPATDSPPKNVATPAFQNASTAKAHGETSEEVSGEALPNTKKKSGSGGGVILLLAAVVAGWWFFLRDKGPDDCDKALLQAQSALVGQSLEDARSHAQNAMSLCKDKERIGKVVVTTQEINKLAAARTKKQEEEQKRLRLEAREKVECDRRLALVHTHLQGRRLVSAGKAFNAIGDKCTFTLGANVSEVAGEIEHRSTEVQQAILNVRRSIDGGDMQAAISGLDSVYAINVEQPELTALRDQIQRLRLNNSHAQPMTSTPAAAPPLAPVPRAQTGSSVAPPTQQVDGGQRELFKTFLRNAAAALQKNQFDKAKAFVESAEQIEPTNRDLARLKRQIKEQELNYLRNGIEIQ